MTVEGLYHCNNTGETRVEIEEGRREIWLVLQFQPAQPISNPSTHEHCRLPWSCLDQPIMSPARENSETTANSEIVIPWVSSNIFHRICPRPGPLTG